ncbi:hypothetical protein CLOM_g20460 [Closterium sp. NIES-68]|nr:hypothetical protein CLOM_g20460 [Closterium sp. NIES-68]
MPEDESKSASILLSDGENETVSDNDCESSSDSESDSDSDSCWEVDDAEMLSDSDSESKTCSKSKNSKAASSKSLRKKTTDDTTDDTCSSVSSVYDKSLSFIRAGDWSKLTVELCKAYLKHHSLRMSGLKVDLIGRIQEHVEIKDVTSAMRKYPPASFSINCTGDVCRKDVVLFRQRIFKGHSKKSKCIGCRMVAGRVVMESYGEKKQQHTFTVEVIWSTGLQALPPMKQLLVKGRYLYKHRTFRQRWTNEAERVAVIGEKHARGDKARSVRRKRLGIRTPTRRFPGRPGHPSNNFNHVGSRRAEYLPCATRVPPGKVVSGAGVLGGYPSFGGAGSAVNGRVGRIAEGEAAAEAMQRLEVRADGEKREVRAAVAAGQIRAGVGKSVYHVNSANHEQGKRRDTVSQPPSRSQFPLGNLPVNVSAVRCESRSNDMDRKGHESVRESGGVARNGSYVQPAVAGRNSVEDKEYRCSKHATCTSFDHRHHPHQQQQHSQQEHVTHPPQHADMAKGKYATASPQVNRHVEMKRAYQLGRSMWGESRAPAVREHDRWQLQHQQVPHQQPHHQQPHHQQAHHQQQQQYQLQKEHHLQCQYQPQQVLHQQQQSQPQQEHHQQQHYQQQQYYWQQQNLQRLQSQQHQSYQQQQPYQQHQQSQHQQQHHHQQHQHQQPQQQWYQQQQHWSSSAAVTTSSTLQLHAAGTVSQATTTVPHATAPLPPATAGMPHAASAMSRATVAIPAASVALAVVGQQQHQWQWVPSQLMLLQRNQQEWIRQHMQQQQQQQAMSYMR